METKTSKTDHIKVSYVPAGKPALIKYTVIGMEGTVFEVPTTFSNDSFTAVARIAFTDSCRQAHKLFSAIFNPEYLFMAGDNVLYAVYSPDAPTSSITTVHSVMTEFQAMTGYAEYNPEDLDDLMGRLALDAEDYDSRWLSHYTHEAEVNLKFDHLPILNKTVLYAMSEIDAHLQEAANSMIEADVREAYDELANINTGVDMLRDMLHHYIYE